MDVTELTLMMLGWELIKIITVQKGVNESKEKTKKQNKNSQFENRGCAVENRAGGEIDDVVLEVADVNRNTRKKG